MQEELYHPKTPVPLELELHEAVALLIVAGAHEGKVLSDEGVDYSLSCFDAAQRLLRAMGKATGCDAWLDQAAELRAVLDQVEAQQ